MLLARQLEWLSRWPLRLGRPCRRWNPPLSPDIISAAAPPAPAATIHHIRCLPHRLTSHRASSQLSWEYRPSRANNDDWRAFTVFSRCYSSTLSNPLSERDSPGMGERNGQKFNEFGHDYTQIGGPIQSSICTRPEGEVHGLIRERMHCKFARDFTRADGILEELKKDGVHIDDRLKQWRVGVVNDRNINEFGHDYTHVGGPIRSSICSRPEGEVHDLIRERMRCKLARDFKGADGILEELGKIGVHVDDKSKQWSVVVLNEFGHEYTQIGGRIDPSICTLTENRIHNLIRERGLCKNARSYRQADEIERKLKQFGVDINDKTKEWRADGTRMISPQRQMGVNQFGHNYTQVGGPIDPSFCTLRKHEIDDLIRERMQYKLSRHFQKADTIQDRLRGFGVDVDDKLKEWRADGRAFRERK